MREEQGTAKPEKKKKILFDLRDAHFYAGTALLSAGFYFIHQPLTLIVPGALFVYIALRRP